MVASKPEPVFTSASEPIVPPAPAVWYAQHVEPGHEDGDLDDGTRDRASAGGCEAGS
ncbi:hypothetical protein QQ054_04385 [Oscillatoria amoena NRMC-F 0135]|nr:hypothetical protein [Oscillatoria amoena NRMC-F 0135]